MPLEAIVHYGLKYNNAFWSGRQIFFGDGDGAIFNRFTIPVEVTAKEFSNGVVQSETRLAYWGQSGALFDSIDENTTALVKQYSLRQTVDQADWLIGTGLFASGIKARALSSLSELGSAYDDSIRGGKDRQVGHMRHYVKTSEDNSGIHINCGIPNRAFYLIAMKIGGYAWEKAGRIWYESIRYKRLRSKAEFRDFAKITLTNARKLYRDGSREVQAVRKEWTEVGISLRK
jgi:Zn-dependent metalloprotease